MKRLEKKHMILVIEDSHAIQKSIQNIFASMPEFYLQFADDGEDALIILEQYTPHLIISDVHMPDVDGIMLLSILKKMSVWREIPFIFITGDETDETKIIAFENGADDYLIKPFKPIDLFIRARALIKKYEIRYGATLDSYLHGQIDNSSLSDVMQIPAIANGTGAIMIHDEDKKEVGYINILQSVIHSASYMDSHGEKSLTKIFSLKKGSFIYKPKLVETKNNNDIINKTIMKSLLDAAQNIDLTPAANIPSSAKEDTKEKLFKIRQTFSIMPKPNST